jgi:tRNA-2-methylthio-N6-dimethylallyladenosine synthase
MEVLVEGKKKGKWYGRTRTDKLVFFEDEGDWLGQLVNIEINKTSPWALQGLP